MITRTKTPIATVTPDVIESHRPELTRYCARKLGSQFDAEDAVQETLIRAWRSADRLQEPAALRPWLYRIAGNVCIDSANRLARLPVPTEEQLEPRDRVPEPDPAELALARENLQLALTAMVDCLPPRQRAVLVLREILCWRAAEVADVLATTVAAVNSALQRAHATLDGGVPDPPAADDAAHRQCVARYLIAFASDDVDALAALSWS
jgi:RNA polymerase sigma-70 factor, ECF subfamily